MLKQFLKECQEILQKNSQTTPIQKLLLDCQNNLNPNDYSLEFFCDLYDKNQEAMQIAIIGQFSSGKSTFLNALLGENILPTGITPITSKVCKICYGDEYILEVVYKNGHKIPQNIDFLHKLTRQNSQNIDYFCLYAPILLLKEINFLDTPGFNSQNQEDTNTTLKILENVDGIIWLTLIDNAGKNSEKQLLKEFIKHYAQKSLCVLNQKDRLKSQEEINLSVQYAKEAFNGIFAEVIPISAKIGLQANLNSPQKILKNLLSNLSSKIQNLIHIENKETLLSTLESDFQATSKSIQSTSQNNTDYINLIKQSNMQAIFDFITHTIKPKATLSKEYSTLKKLKEMHILLHYQYHKTLLCYKSLTKIFINHLHNTTLKSQTHQEKQQQIFNNLYKTLDLLLDSLAQNIYNNLEKITLNFPIKQKSLFKEKIILQSKEVVSLPLEQIKIRLQNQDSPFQKDFKALSAQIHNFCNLFRDLVEEFSKDLKSKAKQWQDKEVQKQEIYKYAPNSQSFKDLQHFSQQYYECLITDFDKNDLLATSNLQSQLHFLSHFLTLNYNNAIESALNKLDLKLKNSIAKHQENQDFAIFSPTLENIRDYLNESFCFEPLQAQLFGPMNLLKKTYSQFLKGLENLTRDKIQLINDKMINLKTEIDKIIKNLQIIKKFMNMEPELLISKQDTKNKEV
ncbi:dynamin family protein [Helicobacter sp.]|uniref:dynamin family protein n=1 Tax=Helicobacter sp. TaxID=218 RepID=UPI00258D3E0D|nr:dynamin family protein [Helicobacter sp.]MCI7047102.1 dynamin family protein [Helicobacter sp.]